MSNPLQINSRIIHRAHPEYGFGIVRYVEENAFGETRLQISFDHIDLLLNVDPGEIELVSDALADAKAGAWGELEGFRRKLSAGLIIGENNLTGGFTKAAVQPLPHQAFLLDKVFASDRFGHVLADDVGLGKTIEAGLIITCLMRREPPQRIMVVCPAGLALQWKDEMDEHFNLSFTILGTDFQGKLESNWRTQPLVIAPIDRLKRDEYREILAQVGNFDLVVCDEAHRLTAQRRFLTQKLEKTSNYRLLEFLVESRLIRHVNNTDNTPRSPRLLLLSATPHQGDDERFLYLLRLARPDLFQPGKQPVAAQLTTARLVETLTRTPKSRAVDWDGKPLFKGHTATTLDVHWTVQETEVSRLLTEYILKSLDFARGSDRGTQLVVQLVMHTFHKLAASSWPALERALKRRLENLKGRVEKLSELLEGDDDEAPNEEVRDFVLPAKAFFENERALLNTLLSCLSNLPVDSKWQSCSKLLSELERNEPGAKILIFTQYRTTQDMLNDRIPKLFPDVVVEVINGDVEMEDRKSARIRFERGSRFMVSTEAGGEGVNLQKSCHLMVNYDLPWNPMRLQQRIGRLDRYRQKQVVHVFNLRVPDSWDQHISTRLLERLEVIQKTMSAAGPGNIEDYREMILGQVAEQVDPAKLFAAAQAGKDVSDGEMDAWIKSALNSMSRWRDLFGSEVGLADSGARLKPTLGSTQFKVAFQLACEAQGIRLRDTRNSNNQFVPEVFNFDLPPVFRDPIFRPSRAMHVVFDREIYAAVRGQDLGNVRGQPIRPVLAGFGEPFTDWLFQTALHVTQGRSAFSLKTDQDCPVGSGWLLVYALRWMGKSRRIMSPDSLIVCHLSDAGITNPVAPLDAFHVIAQATHASFSGAGPTEAESQPAKKIAQQMLKECAVNRDTFARGAAGVSLLCAARIETGVVSS
ncbi:MAG: DEAD/DEAH box helicase [Anaerolineaceae bacterium]|nr:DEAD/DEAH box helicase [Anaerolineaceae bacterium]